MQKRKIAVGIVVAVLFISLTLFSKLILDERDKLILDQAERINLLEEASEETSALLTEYEALNSLMIQQNHSLRRTILNLETMIESLEDDVSRLENSLATLKSELQEKYLAKLTIFFRTNANLTEWNMLLYDISLSINSPFLYSEPIPDVLNIKEEETLMGICYIPILNETEVEVELFLKFELTKQEGIFETGIWGERQYTITVSHDTIYYAEIG